MKKMVILTFLALFAVTLPAAEGMKCGAGKCGGAMKSQKVSATLHDVKRIDGYTLTLSSEKPLTVGDNEIAVAVEKEGKPVSDVKVKIKFFMPEMPGMPYMEYKTKLKPKNGVFKGIVNFSMGGTWQYHLKFKDAAGKVRMVRGSVNL